MYELYTLYINRKETVCVGTQEMYKLFLMLFSIILPDLWCLMSSFLALMEINRSRLLEG